MWSLCLVISECSLSGRGHGHVNNFYIVDLENLATASRRYTGDIHNSIVVGLFMTPIRQWKRISRVMVECTCLLHIASNKTSNVITSICSGLVVQVVSALLHSNWQDFNWHQLHQASRGPSVWVGECFFWYWPSRVVPDKRLLNGCVCVWCRKILTCKLAPSVTN